MFLNGFTVSCSGESGDGIVLNGTGAFLSGPGTVTGCFDGVNVAGSGHHTVLNLTVRNNDFAGVDVESDNNTIAFVTARDNGDGFDVGGDFNSLVQNTATGNGVNPSDEANGFHIEGNHNTLDGNTAKNNQGNGIDIDGDHNTLHANVSTGNGLGSDVDEQNGFDIEGSNNILSNNVASGNIKDGFWVDADHNTLVANSGIHVTISGQFESITGNTALNNNTSSSPTDYDLRDDNPTCDSNSWIVDTFGTKSQACIN